MVTAALKGTPIIEAETATACSGAASPSLEAANVSEFEANMREYATNEAFRAKMKGYTDLYLTGSREILQVV